MKTTSTTTEFRNRLSHLLDGIRSRTLANNVTAVSDGEFVRIVTDAETYCVVATDGGVCDSKGAETPLSNLYDADFGLSCCGRYSVDTPIQGDAVDFWMGR